MWRCRSSRFDEKSLPLPNHFDSEEDSCLSFPKDFRPVADSSPLIDAVTAITGLAIGKSGIVNCVYSHAVKVIS